MADIPKNPDAIHTVARPRPDWLATQAAEDILQPDLPIVDPHHHLWNRGGHRYLLEELLADTGSGHRVEATVFVDCMAHYRVGGPVHLRAIGETEFANGVAAVAASAEAAKAAADAGQVATLACAGIVSFADLMLGDAVDEVLAAHLAAGGARFKGIRHAGAWDASPDIRNAHTQPAQHLYGDARFRAGFAMLAPRGLSFEAWQFHPQLDDVLALARAFPDTAVVLNHVGGVLGVGPYAGQADDQFVLWKDALRALADCPNVVVKVGGLGMRIGPFDFHQRPAPPSSTQLADAWRPYVDCCIEAFGAQRCMFESNFPVDQVSTGYAVLWNAFKRLAAGASADEQAALFAGTARRVYRL